MIEYDYSKLVNLLSEIIWFFRMETKDKSLARKKVYEFCSYYKKKYKLESIPQPRNIDKICSKMNELGMISLLKGGTSDGMHNEYLSIIRGKLDLSEYIRRYEVYMGMQIFGFKKIVEYYSDKVLPLIHIKGNGSESIGTAFILYGGLVTAKHCIDGAQRISIKSVSKEQLESAKFYTHQNTELDLMFIEIENFHYDLVDYVNEPYELDDIITMGFPKIPGFTDFMTKEKAIVASIPSSRLAKSVGAVAAIADEIFAKESLFLITAKIRGGNSGGPVINYKGEIIGVSTQEPLVNSNEYDDLGYGVAVPIKFVIDIREGKGVELNMKGISFIDFTD